MISGVILKIIRESYIVDKLKAMKEHAHYAYFIASTYCQYVTLIISQFLLQYI
jgi:hypothetical protein